MDAHLLYQALDTFNMGVLTDVKRHYRNPEAHPYPAEKNPLLFETTLLLESCGMDDPLHKIYITSHPLEGLPVLLFLFLLTYLPKVTQFCFILLCFSSVGNFSKNSEIFLVSPLLLISFFISFLFFFFWVLLLIYF